MLGVPAGGVSRATVLLTKEVSKEGVRSATPAGGVTGQISQLKNLCFFNYFGTELLLTDERDSYIFIYVGTELFKLTKNMSQQERRLNND